MDLLPAEPSAAIRAKEDYRLLGPNRTIRKLMEQYRNDPDSAPTTDLQKIKKWADIYSWDAFCAEWEARDAEKTEAVLESSRIKRKEKRLRRQDEGLDLCDNLIGQLRAFLTGGRQEVVAHVVSCDPDTGEPEYRYSVEWVPNLTPAQYVNMFPKVISAYVELMKLQKAELGDDTQRIHVTIEQVVNALPAPLQGPMREALYDELLRPAGLEPHRE